eukprot:9471810-Pyramimonas_sp.AAC.1
MNAKAKVSDARTRGLTPRRWRVADPLKVARERSCFHCGVSCWRPAYAVAQGRHVISRKTRVFAQVAHGYTAVDNVNSDQP